MMETIIFIYSFTIEGYDVTVTIKFFPHIIVLKDFSPKLMDDEFENVDTFLKMLILSLICEIANRWRFILFCLTLPLGHFTTGLVYCRNILLLGYFLQKHFTAGLFLTVCFLIMLMCLL